MSLPKQSENAIQGHMSALHVDTGNPNLTCTYRNRQCQNMGILKHHIYYTMIKPGIKSGATLSYTTPNYNNVHTIKIKQLPPHKTTYDTPLNK